MTELTVPEHTFISRSSQFASGAGVLLGYVDHSHFVFKVHDYGKIIPLHLWILSGRYIEICSDFSYWNSHNKA
jgi:hypothetical protein